MLPTAPNFAVEAFLRGDKEFAGPIYEKGKTIRVDFVGGPKSAWNRKLCLSIAEEIQRRVNEDRRIVDKKDVAYWDEAVTARLDQYYKPWMLALPRQLDDGSYETMKDATIRLSRMIHQRNRGSRRNMRISYVSCVLLPHPRESHTSLSF